MSREIKFRAWTGDQMLHALTVTDKVQLFNDGIPADVTGYNWMQSTGLKDKNGKEIYEGDVIDDKGVTWYVEFGNGQYTLRCTCHYPDGDFYVFEDSPTYEVIGNIYENAELLK